MSPIEWKRLCLSDYSDTVPKNDMVLSHCPCVQHPENKHKLVEHWQPDPGNS